MLKNISVDDACEMLLELPVAHKTETVNLENARNRVMAKNLVAAMPIPPFDRSPYDGYAFRGDDTRAASRDDPVTLKLTEEIPAGAQPRFDIEPGFAAKILTGAPMPKGADTTIKYEDTECSGDCDEVRIFEPVKPGANIVYAGSDVKQGCEIAQAGTIITAPLISSLANQGIANVEVYKKPLITVISTGTELCEVGEALRPAAIYNSNTHTLSAYLADAGATPVNGGVVPDEPELIAALLDRAFADSDMVITTGGASVGDYDWAVKSAELAGAEILFWKVALRPGGAIVAAVKGGKLLLSLSGNPAAAVLGLFRVAMPYIKKLCGRADCYFPEINVALRAPLKKDSPKLRLLRGRLEVADTVAYFTEADSQGSESMTSLSGCDLLGEIPMGSPPLPAGTVIKAYRIDVSGL